MDVLIIILLHRNVFCVDVPEVSMPLSTTEGEVGGSAAACVHVDAMDASQCSFTY